MELRKLSRTAKIQLLHDECDRRVRVMKANATKLEKVEAELQKALASGDSPRILVCGRKFIRALKCFEQSQAEAQEMLADMGPLADLFTAEKMVLQEQN